MIESVWVTIFRALIVGLVMGVFWAWNKKAAFAIWFAAVLMLLASFIFLPATEIVDSLHWGFWNWLAMLISVTVGGAIGEAAYREVFR